MHTVVTLSDQGDYSTWHYVLKNVGKYDTYHVPGYQRLNTPDGYETILVSYTSRDRTLVVPLTLRPLPETVRAATGYAKDATSVYGYPGPLLSGPPIDDAWRAEFTASFVRTCAELSVLSVFIRNHPIYDANDAFSAEPFVRSAPTPTVAVDLTAGRDERLALANSHHRRALRKALGRDLTYAKDHGDEAIAGFTACYLETMTKHAASASYLLDEERVATMLSTLGEHAELWVARKPDGGIASAGIFLFADSIVQYHLGGTRSADFELGAARPLFEAVADSGHERGLSWFHLGGGVGGDNDSLLRYKGGFGPERFEYRTIRAILDPAAYAEGTRAAEPDPDRGFFPAYRTTGMGV